MPRLPVESGMLGEDRAARVGLLRRARDDASAERLDEPAAVRLLVVRRPHHPDVHLEAEDPARERERRAPLAGSRLRRQARDTLLLVVVRLRDGGIRLVRARRRDALVLVVDARRSLERAFETASTVERRRPPLAIDRAHLLRDRDEPVRRDLLQDDLHREERREVVRSDRLSGTRMEHGRRRCREIGGDVVPGLRQPVLVEDVLHLIGHLALLSLATAVTWSLAQPASTGKR